MRLLHCVFLGYLTAKGLSDRQIQLISGHQSKKSRRYTNIYG